MKGLSDFGCVSISNKKAEADLRGRLAFSGERTAQLLADLPSQLKQAVILCTCCRTEIYFCGSIEAATQLLSTASGIDCPKLLPHTDSFVADKAVRHLFRVAGGLRSAVLGEDEILRQVKAAYQLAKDQGSTGYELNRVFQAAIACGKRIRSETEISRIPISTATLAANKAAGFKESVSVLVIGASGMIGSSVLKNLLSHSNVTAAATVRKCGGRIAAGGGVTQVDYSRRYEAVAAADCIISATSSPHYTITLRGLEQHGITGRKLFIDLAVPADIDKSIAGQHGFELIGIDEFGRLAAKNNEARKMSAEAAEYIISEELETLGKELLCRSCKAEIANAIEFFGRSPEKALYTLKRELSADGFEAVLKALGGS